MDCWKYCKGYKFALSVARLRDKKLSATGGLRPPDQGLCPWTPLGALPSHPRYRLALHALAMCPQNCPWPPLFHYSGTGADSMYLFGYRYVGNGDTNRREILHDSRGHQMRDKKKGEGVCFRAFDGPFDLKYLANGKSQHYMSVRA